MSTMRYEYDSENDYIDHDRDCSAKELRSSLWAFLALEVLSILIALIQLDFLLKRKME